MLNFRTVLFGRGILSSNSTALVGRNSPTFNVLSSQTVLNHGVTFNPLVQKAMLSKKKEKQKEEKKVAK